MIDKKTFLDNAADAWQFSLDVAWDQNRRHPELSRGKCLRERSFLRTLLQTDQAEVFAKACVMADKVDDKYEMDILLPELLGYMEENLYPPSLDNPEFAPGRSFRYALNDKHYCYIHIRNAKVPVSFLRDPEYVAAGLREMMDISEEKDGCSVIYTATWLNSLPAFLRFFPEEWKQNIYMLPGGEFGPTTGWQGQFINGKGLLNKAHAAEFLRTGVLPYARVESFCPFSSLREHLKKIGL